jgi:maltooligosyltrehalose trehalohydrolase
MGEEYGETSPFQYFVSHGDPTLVEAVRVGRRREFEAFGSMGAAPDPQAEETFLRSRLDRTLSARPRHAELLALYRDLLQLRREEPALRPGNAQVDVASDATEEWITVCLTPPTGATLLAAFNLSARTCEVPAPTIQGGCWRVRLTTEDPRYGGSGGQEGTHPSPRVWLPAHTAFLLRPETT